MEEISVITAVHHPLRRRIVDHLLLHDTAQVGTLAQSLKAQVGSISHHLRMLQRAGVVEQVADPNGDKRTSWWRLVRRSISWSTKDFTDTPADAYLAREAERLNVVNQFERLNAWKRASAHREVEGFTTDTLAWATAEELADLQSRVNEAVTSWRNGIDEEDGQQRMPVFFFAHGFPTEV